MHKEIDHIAEKTNFNGKNLLAATGADIDIQLDVSGDKLTIASIMQKLILLTLLVPTLRPADASTAIII